MSDEKTAADQADRQPGSTRSDPRGQAEETAPKKRFQIQVEGEEQPHTEMVDELEFEMDLGEAIRRLDEAEELVRKHQDDVLRVQADMQNLRRRTEQDVEKAHKYGQERFITELLPVIDNLERALEAARIDDPSGNESAAELDKLKAIREGVDLTLKSFLDCFRKFSIEPIDPLGEPFDPQAHQAMAMVEDARVEPNSVTAVVQKGYRLHGRVIRPAMVLVSK